MLATETLDQIMPIEIEVEGVPACKWPYFERSEKGVVAAWYFEQAIDQDCKRLGFPDYTHHNVEGLGRELRLLGPDSPGEYVYRFDRRLIGDAGLQALWADMYWFIKRMAVIYRLQSVRS